jgi:hypothetical protein
MIQCYPVLHNNLLRPLNLEMGKKYIGMRMLRPYLTECDKNVTILITIVRNTLTDIYSYDLYDYMKKHT